MSTLISLAHVTHEVTRGARTYLTARPNYAAFAPYDTARALLTALLPSSDLPYDERDALIIAIVGEHQRAPHPLWQALLLASFERLLLRLRHMMGKRKDEDLDQRVLLAFLESLRTVSVGSYTIMAIRWATEETLQMQRRAEARGPRMVPFDEEEMDRCDPFATSPEVKLAADEVIRMIESQEGPELLDVILAVHVADESLREYVDCTYPCATTIARAAAYERLKLGRQRVVGEIRHRLGPRTRAA